MTDKTVGSGIQLTDKKYCNLPCKKALLVTQNRNFVARKGETFPNGKLLYLTQTIYRLTKDTIQILLRGKYDIFYHLEFVCEDGGLIHLEIPAFHYQKTILAHKYVANSINISLRAEIDSVTDWNLVLSNGSVVPSINVKKNIVIVERICEKHCPKRTDILKNIAALD